MTIDDLYKKIDEENLDMNVLTAGGYGTIDLYVGDSGEYHLVINGERGPEREFDNLTESEACELALQFVRRFSRKRRTR